MKEWLDRRTDGCRDGWRDGCKYVCMSTCYSAPSRFLFRGAPGYSADAESEFHAEVHEQLRVKDLPRVPTRRLEVDSNPQPSGCKAPNIPLHHRAPQLLNSGAMLMPFYISGMVADWITWSLRAFPAAVNRP